MKKYIKTLIVFVILAALAISYYFYLSNRTPNQDATEQAVTNKEYAALSIRDILSNYPESPRSVVELYARIAKQYYQSGLTDEQIENLGKQARLLFDDELKGTQTEEDFLESLKQDVADFHSKGRFISDFKIDSASNFKYKTLQNREYSIGTVLFYIREGSGLNNSYHSFKLRKDSNGNWKILYWELVENE